MRDFIDKLLNAMSYGKRFEERAMRKELYRTRILTGRRFANQHELLLDALKTYNMTLAFGMNPGDVEEMCKKFAQGISK